MQDKWKKATVAFNRSKQPCLAGYKIEICSNVMVTPIQDKTDNCISKTVLYSVPKTIKDHHGFQKNNLLVIFAKFAFDWSNISVMPRAFRGSFKSVSATAVNLVETNEKKKASVLCREVVLNAPFLLYWRRNTYITPKTFPDREMDY